MLRVHKICLSPTPQQEVLFAKSCGVARKAFNWALDNWEIQYQQYKNKEILKAPSEAALRKQLNAIKEQEFPYMAEVSKNAPQQAIKNLGTAYKNAFDRIKKGAASPKDIGFPKHKKKYKHDSFRADNGPSPIYSKTETYFCDKDQKVKPKIIGQNDAVKVVRNVMTLPKIGDVKMREQLRFGGLIKSATVSRIAGKWYVAISVDVDASYLARGHRGEVGVDLGIATLAYMSDGTTEVGAKPHKKLLARLQLWSRRVNKNKKLGSNNRRKAIIKLATLHARISNIRRDMTHKLTTRLATQYSEIGIETLHVKGMTKNHGLARSILDHNFGEFKRQLEYKTAMYGGLLQMADRWFPSSHLCSDCDTQAPSMKLSVREWTCQDCGVVHDRDENAAKNLAPTRYRDLEQRYFVNERWHLPRSSSAADSFAVDKACGDRTEVRWSQTLNEGGSSDCILGATKKRLQPGQDNVRLC